MILDKLTIPVNRMKFAIDQMDWSDKRVYANFLAQTYYYVGHSTKLLAFGAGLMPLEERQYFRRFINHITEESNHELLALKDLEELGYKIEDFPELPETRALWEPQYYKILRIDPMSFMGYILVLEQFACLHFPELLQTLKKHHGDQALRFVKLHAEEDPDHVEKAVKFTESLDKSRHAEVNLNIEQTALSYSLMCNQCHQLEQPQTTHLHVKTTEQQPLHI